MKAVIGKTLLVVIAILVIVADPVRYLLSMVIDFVLIGLFLCVLFMWFDLTPKE